MVTGVKEEKDKERELRAHCTHSILIEVIAFALVYLQAITTRERGDGLIKEWRNCGCVVTFQQLKRPINGTFTLGMAGKVGIVPVSICKR